MADVSAVLLSLGTGVVTMVVDPLAQPLCKPGIKKTELVLSCRS